MKNQNHSKLYLFGIAILLTLAIGFGYSGWINELDESNSELTRIHSDKSSTSQLAVLDTLQYIEKACYEYVNCRSECNESETQDYLTKTVIKIEKPNGEFETLTENSIKDLPANASLNLMVEQYKVERRITGNIPSFHVTMESFNTHLEFDAFQELKKFPFSEPEASLSQRDLENIKKGFARNIRLKPFPKGI